MVLWLRLKTFYANCSTLQVALACSVAVHALSITTVRIVDPESFNRVFEDTPLEVILVNAKTNERLDDLNAQAQAIAQHRLNGGGEAQTGLASSPLPSSQIVDAGTSVEQMEAQIERLQAQQMRMLSQIKEQVLRLPKTDPTSTSKAQGAALEKKRMQLLKLLAAIERRINTENARPKRRYVSPATRQAAYAIYYDELRRKIEQRGTENFPQLAGRKLYGELTMLITINFDGHVQNLEIANGGSGDKMLDARAKAIVRQAAPYGAFTPAMRKQADQLVVVSRFQFTKDALLQATMHAQ